MGSAQGGHGNGGAYLADVKQPGGAWRHKLESGWCIPPGKHKHQHTNVHRHAPRCGQDLLTRATKKRQSKANHGLPAHLNAPSYLLARSPLWALNTSHAPSRSPPPARTVGCLQHQLQHLFPQWGAAQDGLPGHNEHSGGSLSPCSVRAKDIKCDAG